MTATPPEANTEYSRAAAASSRGPEGRRTGSSGTGRRHLPVGVGGLGAALILGGLLGALLLLVAEFTPLYTVHAAGIPRAVKTVSTGSHHTYALVPIAILAAVFAVAAGRAGSRPALLALGLLGVLSLLIALLGDLPDANAHGLLLRGGRFVLATASPSAGLYLETLGGVVLLVTAVSGFLLAEPPQPRPRRPARAARP